MKNALRNRANILVTVDDSCVIQLTMAGAVTPALPVLTPDWTDFHRCDQRFGIGINPADCQVAGSFLPRGWDQTPYYTSPGHAPEGFTLPWSKTVGEQLTGQKRVKERGNRLMMVPQAPVLSTSNLPVP